MLPWDLTKAKSKKMNRTLNLFLFLEMYLKSSCDAYLSVAQSKFKAEGEPFGVQTWF